MFISPTKMALTSPDVFITNLSTTNSRTIPFVPSSAVGNLVSVKLKGENYFLWKAQIVPALHSQDLFKFVDGSFPPPNEFLSLEPNSSGDSPPESNPAYISWRCYDQLVLSWINATLTESVLVQVVGRLTSKDAWEALEQIYSSHDSQIWLLKEQLNSLFKGNTPMRDYLNRVKDIRDAFAAAEGPISNTDLVCSTVKGLPSNILSFVSKIEQEPDFNYLMELLLNHDSGPDTGLVNSTELPSMIKYYLPLHRASIQGDWKTAKRFFDSDPNALKAHITDAGHTALSIAAMSAQTKFMENLIQLIQPIDLELVKEDRFTALHDVATTGNTKAAKILVTKNPHLTQIRNKFGETPLLRAALYGHKDLVWYLCSVTKDIHPSPFKGEDGVRLLISTIEDDHYDVALYLLQRYPEMATTRFRDLSAIQILATKSWPSMCGYGIRFWHCYINSLLNIKNFYDIEIMHRQYLKVVAYTCDQMALSNEDSKMFDLMSPAILLASEYGNVEVIKLNLKVDPTLIWSRNLQNHHMLHLAVKYRQEKVFKYLKEIGVKDEWASKTDDSSGDNILHLAARLGPTSKLKSISGAALQVQHELQWYKEVEKNVQPGFRINLNKTKATPRALFTEQHRELVEKGEKWMKDMASASMVVATLIATVVFAAAFTVPGGNISDTGIPVFLHTSAYKVFAVSNALALFSSLTSVLMFLSILTARYAEEDFLKSLPEKLIIGLTMLFFAIATMTIAFSATYFIMLGHKLAWVSTLIAFLTCLPVTLFAFSQLPLFREMIHSTYKSSV